MNIWKDVQGVLFTKKDIESWPTDKYLDFFRFFSFFIDDGVVKVTDEKRAEMEKYFEIPHHPYHEFLWRINCFVLNPKATSKMFYNRLAASQRLIGMYLKENPSIISGEMRDVLSTNVKFQWMLPEKQPGLPSTDLIDPANMPTDIQTTDITITNTLTKTAGVFNEIVDSIKRKDINSLSLKEKISALKSLSFIFTQVRQMKPESKVFNNINIIKASREDLEKAVLNFGEDNE